MVATRRQGRQRLGDKEQEPPQNDYERRRDAQVAAVEKKMEELGLKKLANDIKENLSKSSSNKGKKSANKKANSEDSDSSEYLLDSDDQGDSDDDDTESDGQPQPLATKYPPGFTPRKQASKRKTRGQHMAPGVRVRKRVRVTEASENAPPSQTRASKRLQVSPRDGQSEEELLQRCNTAADEGNGAGCHDSTALEEESASAQHDCTGAAEDNATGQDHNEDPAQQAPRKRRPRTKGTHLDKITKAMGGRMPIVVEKGKRRPHDPVQAAKFASESGVIIRDKVPVLKHWKDYKDNERYYNNYVGKLAARLAINKEDAATKEACADMLRSGVRQMRYRLKKKYFDGIPANQIPTTSPVASMSDLEWQALVAKWTNPKNMETSEKNKINRSKVKYHQTTGSRSYVAHLHAFKQHRNNAEPSTHENEELDVVEAFKTCHTSSKTGLSEQAREAVSNMEALRAEPVAEGEAGVSSVQVVSQVLTKNSSKAFLRSLGIKPVGSSTSAAPNESELREPLAVEARAAVQDELDALKKRSDDANEKLERQQREMEEMRKQAEMTQKEMQENNALLKRLLSFNNVSST